MLTCCQSTLKLMQDIEGLSDMLTFYLKASPYAVLVPELATGLLSEGVKETIKGQIQDMAIQMALDKATGADKLPDLKSAIEAVGKIKLGRIQAFAQIHSLAALSPKHTGKETQFWNKLIAFYDPNKAPTDSGNGGGWDFNPFW